MVMQIILMIVLCVLAFPLSVVSYGGEYEDGNNCWEANYWKVEGFDLSCNY